MGKIKHEYRKMSDIEKEVMDSGLEAIQRAKALGSSKVTVDISHIEAVLENMDQVSEAVAGFLLMGYDAKADLNEDRTHYESLTIIDSMPDEAPVSDDSYQEVDLEKTKSIATQLVIAVFAVCAVAVVLTFWL